MSINEIPTPVDESEIAFSMRVTDVQKALIRKAIYSAISNETTSLYADLGERGQRNLLWAATYASMADFRTNPYSERYNSQGFILNAERAENLIEVIRNYRETADRTEKSIATRIINAIESGMAFAIQSQRDVYERKVQEIERVAQSEGSDFSYEVEIKADHNGFRFTACPNDESAALYAQSYIRSSHSIDEDGNMVHNFVASPSMHSDHPDAVSYTTLQAAQIAAEGFLATQVTQARLYEARRISKAQALLSEMESVSA